MSDDTVKELQDQVATNLELLIRTSSLDEYEVQQAVGAIIVAEIELENRSNA